MIVKLLSVAITKGRWEKKEREREKKLKVIERPCCADIYYCGSVSCVCDWDFSAQVDALRQNNKKQRAPIDESNDDDDDDGERGSCSSNCNNTRTMQCNKITKYIRLRSCSMNFTLSQEGFLWTASVGPLADRRQCDQIRRNGRSTHAMSTFSPPPRQSINDKSTDELIISHHSAAV